MQRWNNALCDTSLCFKRSKATTIFFEEEGIQGTEDYEIRGLSELLWRILSALRLVAFNEVDAREFFMITGFYPISVYLGSKLDILVIVGIPRDKRCTRRGEGGKAFRRSVNLHSESWKSGTRFGFPIFIQIVNFQPQNSTQGCPDSFSCWWRECITPNGHYLSVDLRFSKRFFYKSACFGGFSKSEKIPLSPNTSIHHIFDDSTPISHIKISTP